MTLHLVLQFRVLKDPLLKGSAEPGLHAVKANAESAGSPEVERCATSAAARKANRDDKPKPDVRLRNTK